MAGLQAIELIDRIHKEQGKTIVIIEHRLEDVLHRPVDRVILMNRGRIVADTTPAQLLCSTLLQENGIREPLYLTALKYAGCAVGPQDEPDSIATIRLDDKLQRLRTWFAQTVEPPVRQAGPCVAELQHAVFSYDKKPVLKDVSFRLCQGERVALIGKNGAGKSTIAHLLMGIRRPKGGSILVEGKDYASLSIKEIGERIGYVMQNPNQMISKTMIYDEVALGLQRSGLTEEQIREKVEATLRVCGLYPFRNWPISALSFGQKKRVTIASVLVLDPELILLDEPTAGQDFRHYTDIMEFLRGLNARGVTVVMITHDMHLMLEYTRRALVFCDGRLIADRTAAAVLCDPALVEQAALKETSLYTLANRCGIAPAQEFVERFIEQDREVREGGC